VLENARHFFYDGRQLAPFFFGWLTKGHQAWSENHDVFEQDEATVTLGIEFRYKMSSFRHGLPESRWHGRTIHATMVSG
jgi:hypothetical protein